MTEQKLRSERQSLSIDHLLPRNRLILFSVLAVLLLALQGCNLLPQEEEVKEVALLPPPEEKITVVQVERGDIVEEMKKVCQVESTRERILYFTEEGAVKDIFVKEDEWVEEGQVLACLETGELEYQTKASAIDLEAAKIRLEQLRTEVSLGVYSEQALRLQELEYEKARLNHERFKERLAGSVIKAPYSGQIRTISVKDGEQVEDYEEILKITDPSRVRLIVEVTSIERAEVQPGLKLRLEVEDKVWLNGRVTLVPSAKDKLPDGTEDLRLFIELEPNDYEFKHLSLFPVVITLREAKDTLILKRSAIRQYFDRYYVRLMDGDTIKEVDVEVGIEGSTHVEILKGLQEGDRVIPK
jgi:RND family efflux transporter MFP subunit